MAKYKNKIKNNQLIVKVKLVYGERINTEELRFFSIKDFDNFLKVRTVKNNVIEYIGPIGINLGERLKRPISCYDFFFIIEQIVIMIRKIQGSTLSINNVVLDFYHIFINETTKEIRFIYLPIENKQGLEDISCLIENLIYSVVPIHENSNDFSKFLYFLKNMTSFDIDAIEKYILKVEKEVIDVIRGQQELTDNDDKTEILNYDEETGIMNDYNEETILLDEDSQVRFPNLCRISTGEIIYIKKAVFRVGREKNYVDYAVVNNNRVSRKHIDIISRGQRYFIIGLNAKNNTWINEKVIPEQCEVEIFDKDRIKLADEEFVFEC